MWEVDGEKLMSLWELMCVRVIQIISIKFAFCVLIKEDALNLHI
jgi:hypothetical protein